LKAQLRANYIVNVGGKVFRVDKEILEKRDAPNFFTSFGYYYYYFKLLKKKAVCSISFLNK
jgi:hypothetical protein